MTRKNFINILKKRYPNWRWRKFNTSKLEATYKNLVFYSWAVLPGSKFDWHCKCDQFDLYELGHYNKKDLRKLLKVLSKLHV